MANKDFSNIGEQIRESVEHAIDSMDFTQLNHTISDTVNRALDEARKQMDRSGWNWKNERQSRTRKKDDSVYVDVEYRECTEEESEKKDANFRQKETAEFRQREAAESRQKEEAESWQREAARFRQNEKVECQRRKPAKEAGCEARVNQIGKVAGILYIVFGSIGLGVAGILLLVVLIVAMVARPVWGAFFGVSIFLAVLAGIFGFMLGKGNSIRKRLKRLRTYAAQIGEKKYCQISELAARVGKNSKFVVKDLKKMISLGMLQEAYLDGQETYLILDSETYQQYLQAVKIQSIKEQEEKSSQEKRQELEKMPELKRMAEEGKRYLEAIRKANDAIPGEVISAKLTRLEQVTHKIFQTVEEHPEQIDEMQRFMDYYLPTTVKLVEAYKNFDCVEIQGQNITMAKSEIEDTLDTINEAFERLLDDLYQDAALDASTDASVLQTMLKKDGWTGSDFNRRTDI